MKLLEIDDLLCSRPMVLAAVSLVIGICIGEYPGIFPLICAVLLLGFILFAYFRSKNDKIKNGRLLILFLAVLSFLTGLIRIKDTKSLFSDSFFPDRSLKDTVVEAVISDISLGKDQFILILENPKIFLSPKYNEADISQAELDSKAYNGLLGKILVYIENIDDADVGDIIRVKGALYSFNQATNYGQFDQRSYYIARGITLKIYADEMTVSRKNGSLKGFIKKKLLNLSLGFQDGLCKTFDDKDMGILSAMLIGNRSELDDGTKGLYQKIGLAHILSISGLHITLLGMGLFNLLLYFSKKLRFSVICTLIILFLYGILTGFSVSTIRAFIMLACTLAARFIGKAYDGQSAAGFAAIIILTMNPLELFESGFQLSFIAVFGIFAGNEIRKNFKLKNKLLIYLMPALSAQISTFPVILRTYYSFSPYSVIANILLLPFMSVIVLSGFLAGILGYISLGLESGILLIMAKVTAGPAHFLLLGYEKVSELLLKLPGADIITGCPTFVRCIIYYSVLFILVFYSFRISIKIKHYMLEKRVKERAVLENEKKKSFIINILMIASMIIILLFKRKNMNLYSAFIDVGQGLSMYVEAGGKDFLFDGGSSNVKNVGKYRIEPYLLWHGVSKIDYCFVSHTDEDHISGIRELIENDRIHIDHLAIGNNYDESEPLLALAGQKGIKVLMVEAGYELFEENSNTREGLGDEEDNSGISIRILSPDMNFIYEDKNQASLVARISYGNISMLFTGDSDIYAESEYLKQLNESKKINVLQCPHHGSKYSGSQLLLDTIKPDVCVISCSKTNNYGHPSPETLERLDEAGSDTYITSKNGMIIISYKGEGEYTVTKYITK